MVSGKKAGFKGYEFIMSNLYFSNIFKSFKYYFKHFLYIVVANGIALFVYRKFLYRSFPIRDIFNLLLMIALLSIIKIILYSNSIVKMKKSIPNDTMDLVGLTFKRFVPVLTTLLIYFIMVGFFALFFIIPGIYFLISYVFGIFFAAFGDMNEKNKEGYKGDIVYISGIEALERSKRITKGNRIKFLFMTVVAVGVVYGLQELVMFIVGNFQLKWTVQIRRFVTLCIWDILYIYFAYIFMKLCLLEKEILDKKADEEKKEKDAMEKGTKKK
ncbi:MAG: hypothetical protein LBH46_01605 [Rickettsiales bacterium]|jgi:hypothetical protein|nr:hypothetical protein [Rickettsiales bacterium]